MNTGGGWFDPELLRAFRFFGTVSLNIVISVFLGFYIGRLLDAKLGTDPWLGMLGFILGAGAGFLGVYRLSASEFRDKDDERKMK